MINKFIKIKKGRRNRNKDKYKFIDIILKLYIIINIDIKFSTIGIRKKILYYYSNKINYKGKKLLKDKLINNYLERVSDEYKSYKNEERNRFYKFSKLANYPNDSSVKSEFRRMFLAEISKLKNKTINQIDTFYISRNFNFGNSLISINNVIFYCEVVRCKNIILNQKNLTRRWLLPKKTKIEKLNITIIQDSNVDCNSINIICVYQISYDIFFPKVIIPEVRIYLVKKDILNNLPKVPIERNALYIHIRGGDVFKGHPPKYYSQPPLCFYEKIINQTKYKSIYIISVDKANNIVGSLLRKYKNIVHNMNNFEYDISLLAHAYNIVLSVSSFSISAIKLNNNLKELWEYDIFRLSEKFLFLHHHFYKFSVNYKIHTMKPSDLYASKMFYWKRTPEQIRLMMEDNCPYDFTITKPNI